MRTTAGPTRLKTLATICSSASSCCWPCGDTGVACCATGCTAAPLVEAAFDIELGWAADAIAWVERGADGALVACPISPLVSLALHPAIATVHPTRTPITKLRIL